MQKGDEVYKVMSLLIEMPSENQALLYVCKEIARNITEDTQVLRYYGSFPAWKHNVHGYKRKVGAYAPDVKLSFRHTRNTFSKNNHLQMLIDDAIRRPGGKSIIADV